MMTLGSVVFFLTSSILLSCLSLSIIKTPAFESQLCHCLSDLRDGSKPFCLKFFISKMKIMVLALPVAWSCYKNQIHKRIKSFSKLLIVIVLSQYNCVIVLCCLVLHVDLLFFLMRLTPCRRAPCQNSLHVSHSS